MNKSTEAKTVAIIVVVICLILLVSSCSTFGNYHYYPYVTIVNQYNYPMEISFSDYSLRPSYVSKIIPAKTEYSLYFPNGYDSLLRIQVRGILFSDYHSELAFVSSYGTETIIPEADYGYLGIEYKKTILSDVSEIYVEYAGKRDLYTFSLSHLEYPASRSYSNSIKSIAFETNYIRVSADSCDYLYVSKYPFGSLLEEKTPVGDKIRVNKGEVVIVTVSLR